MIAVKLGFALVAIALMLVACLHMWAAFINALVVCQ